MSNSNQYEFEQTSSVGAGWPPAPGPHERLRGIYTEQTIETAQDCCLVTELFEHYSSELERCDNLSRVVLRFVVRIQQLKLLESMGVNIEAAVPLGGSFGGTALAYIAQNKPQRMVEKQVVTRHSRLLETIRTERHRDEREQSAVLASNGFSVFMIDADTADSERRSREQQFLNLYKVFGYELSEVRTVLFSPTNSIVAVEREGEVISTAMAERATLPITGAGDLNLYEITEASTHRDYRRRGLYKAASGVLLQHLMAKQLADPVHAIYGESNLAMPGVLIAGYENGRRLNHFDRDLFGVQNEAFGILQQNFRVEDGRETRPYNDFAVSYVELDNKEERV